MAWMPCHIVACNHCYKSVCRCFGCVPALLWLPGRVWPWLFLGHKHYYLILLFIFNDLCFCLFKLCFVLVTKKMADMKSITIYKFSSKGHSDSIIPVNWMSGHMFADNPPPGPELLKLKNNALSYPPIAVQIQHPFILISLDQTFLTVSVLISHKLFPFFLFFQIKLSWNFP